MARCARPVRAAVLRGGRPAPACTLAPGAGSDTALMCGAAEVDGAVDVRGWSAKPRRGRRAGRDGGTGRGDGGPDQQGRQQAEARIPKSTNRRRVSIRAGAVARAGWRPRAGTSPPTVPPRFPDMFVRMMGNCWAVQRLSAIAPIGIRHRSGRMTPAIIEVMTLWTASAARWAATIKDLRRGLCAFRRQGNPDRCGPALTCSSASGAPRATGRSSRWDRIGACSPVRRGSPGALPVVEGCCVPGRPASGGSSSRLTPAASPSAARPVGMWRGRTGPRGPRSSVCGVGMSRTRTRTRPSTRPGPDPGESPASEPYQLDRDNGRSSGYASET